MAIGYTCPEKGLPKNEYPNGYPVATDCAPVKKTHRMVKETEMAESDWLKPIYYGVAIVAVVV